MYDYGLSLDQLDAIADNDPLAGRICTSTSKVVCGISCNINLDVLDGCGVALVYFDIENSALTAASRNLVVAGSDIREGIGTNAFTVVWSIGRGEWQLRIVEFQRMFAPG